MKLYNKKDLVDSISEVNGINKAEADRVINYFFKGLENVVSNLEADDGDGKGDKLQLVGKMTIEAYHRKEYMGHSPRKADEKIPIPAQNKLKVKLGTDLVSQLAQPSKKR